MPSVRPKYIYNLHFIAFVLPLLVATTCSALSVELQWNPNREADLAGYRVYYTDGNISLPFNGSDAAEGASPVEVGILGSAPSITLNGLDSAKTYYLAVTAYNQAGQESSFSNIVAVNTPKGDINDDGSVNLLDALLAQKMAVGKMNATSEQLSRGDVAPLINGIPAANGVIDTGDTVVILNIALGNLSL